MITAIDAAMNEGDPSPESAPITVLSGPSAIFTDDFSSGSLANWTSVTRFTIDAANGSLAAPSARAAVSNQTAFLTKTLGATYTNLCLSWRVNVAARTGSIMLLRLRSASSGPVARVLVNTSGVLALRSDVSGVTRASTTALGSGWHGLEVCGTVGAAGTWDSIGTGSESSRGGSRTPGRPRSEDSSWGTPTPARGPRTSTTSAWIKYPGKHRARRAPVGVV